MMVNNFSLKSITAIEPNDDMFNALIKNTGNINQILKVQLKKLDYLINPWIGFRWLQVFIGLTII